MERQESRRIFTNEATTQTMYRESEAQTNPYSPEYVVKNDQKHEILLLEKYAFENGHLTITQDELDVINYLRERARRVQSLPEGSTNEVIARRQRMLEEIHRDDAAVNENYIRKLNETKIKDNRESLEDNMKCQESEIRQRLEALQQIKPLEWEKAQRRLETALDRNLRFILRKKDTESSIAKKIDLEVAYKSGSSIGSRQVGGFAHSKPYEENNIEETLDFASSMGHSALSGQRTPLVPGQHLEYSGSRFSLMSLSSTSSTHSQSQSQSQPQSHFTGVPLSIDSRGVDELINILDRTLARNKEVLTSTDALAIGHPGRHTVLQQQQYKKLLVPDKLAITKSRVFPAVIRDRDAIRDNVDIVYASTQQRKQERATVRVLAEMNSLTQKKAVYDPTDESYQKIQFTDCASDTRDLRVLVHDL